MNSRYVVTYTGLLCVLLAGCTKQSVSEDWSLKVAVSSWHERKTSIGLPSQPLADSSELLESLEWLHRNESRVFIVKLLEIDIARISDDDRSLYDLWKSRHSSEIAKAKQQLRREKSGRHVDVVDTKNLKMARMLRDFGTALSIGAVISSEKSDREGFLEELDILVLMANRCVQIPAFYGIRISSYLEGLALQVSVEHGISGEKTYSQFLMDRSDVRQYEVNAFVTEIHAFFNNFQVSNDWRAKPGSAETLACLEDIDRSMAGILTKLLQKSLPSTDFESYWKSEVSKMSNISNKLLEYHVDTSGFVREVQVRQETFNVAIEK